MNKKMKKKSLFLIIWIGCIILAAVFANLGSQLFPEGSVGYTVFGVFTLIPFVTFIVFLIRWKKTCSSCKEGKMILLDYEDGDSISRTVDVIKADKVKDSKGNLVGTIERKEQETSIWTPKFKIYKCDHCGYESKKVASVRKS
jgi:hypothetical protein